MKKSILLWLMFVLLTNLSFAFDNTASPKKVYVKTLVSTVQKSGGAYVLLSNTDVQKDKDGIFVYKLEKDMAVKTYLKTEKYYGQLLVLDGLKKGDHLVSQVLIDLGGEKIRGRFIANESRIPVEVMNLRRARRPGKRIRNTERAISPSKSGGLGKVEFEAGFSSISVDLAEFFIKDKAPEELIGQYANRVNKSVTKSGDFGKFGSMLPLFFGINYRLKEDLIIKGGIEFASTSAASNRNYQVLWDDNLTEDYKIAATHDFSYIMPYIGFEKRFDSFGVYGNIGLNAITYDYNYTYNFTEQSYWQKRTELVSATASGVALTLGVKYRQRIVNRLTASIKLEYFLSSFGSITADKMVTGSTSSGESLNESVSGTIYTLEMDPNSIEYIKTWDVYSTLPTESWIKNVAELTVKLSSVRFGIVLSF